METVISKPISKRAQKRIERDDAIESLRKMAPHGSTLYTIVRHVSASGMNRVISVYALTTTNDGQPSIQCLDWYAEKVLDWKRSEKHGEGIKVSGCGMDMGYHLVYSLARAVWRDVEPNGDCGYSWRQAWL